MLTIFYDGHCPLCTKEMALLQQLNVHHKLILEDIHAEDFTLRFPHIDVIEADNILHGQLDNGQVIRGLEVTCLAWKIVGKHKWLQILRWPFIRFFADRGYLFFARHRHAISSFITRTPRCDTCQKEP